MNRIVLLAIVCIATGIGYYASLPSSVITPPATVGVQAEVKNLPSSANRLISSQPNMTFSDPFAIPVGYQVTDVVSAGATSERAYVGQPIQIGASKSSEPPMALSGVGGSGSQRFAIIRYGGKTQPYSINESIGSYKLVGVAESTVTLLGPNGKVVLTMGR